jgi:hypothetical protein
MKKWVVVAVGLFFLVSAAVAVYAGCGGFMGEDGKPKGCLCCINGVCLMAKTDADCQKAGGKVIKVCEDCKAE